jgi:hypothetical protein
MGSSTRHADRTLAGIAPLHALEEVEKPSHQQQQQQQKLLQQR